MQQYLEFLINSAKEEWETAQYLLDGRRYGASLFYCHLTIETLLKALIVHKTKQSPPYLHQLDRLARKAKINLTDRQVQELVDITEFNISTRYPEEKRKLYNKTTKAFTLKYFQICTIWRTWLLKELNQN